MPDPYLIPLEPSVQHQEFSVALDGVEIGFRLRWNARARNDQGAWMMDICDRDFNPIYTGVCMALGTLLGKRCVDPRLPAGSLILADLSGDGEDAGLDDFGTRVILLYYPPEE